MENGDRVRETAHGFQASTITMHEKDGEQQCDSAQPRVSSFFGRLLSLPLAQEQIDAIDELSTGERFRDVVVGAEFVAAEDIFVLDLSG